MQSHQCYTCMSCPIAMEIKGSLSHILNNLVHSGPPGHVWKSVFGRQSIQWTVSICPDNLPLLTSFFPRSSSGSYLSNQYFTLSAKCYLNHLNNNDISSINETLTKIKLAIYGSRLLP